MKHRYVEFKEENTEQKEYKIKSSLSNPSLIDGGTKSHSTPMPRFTIKPLSLELKQSSIQKKFIDEEVQTTNDNWEKEQKNDNPNNCLITITDNEGVKELKERKNEERIKKVRCVSKLSAYLSLAAGTMHTQLTNPPSKFSVSTAILMLSELLLITQDFLKESMVRKKMLRQEARARKKEVKRSSFYEFVKDYAPTLVGAGIGAVCTIGAVILIPYALPDYTWSQILAAIEFCSIIPPVTCHMITSRKFRKRSEEAERESAIEDFNNLCKKIIEEGKIDSSIKSIRRIFDLVIIPDLEKLGLTEDIIIEDMAKEIGNLKNWLKRFRCHDEEKEENKESGERIGFEIGVEEIEGANLFELITFTLKTLEYLEKKNEELNGEFKEKNKKITELEEKVESLDGELIKVGKELDNAKNREKELIKKLRSTNEKIDDNTREISDLKSQLEKQKEENKKLKEKTEFVSKQKVPMPEKNIEIQIEEKKR